LISYLLDTDICIYINNSAPERVLERFRQQQVGTVGMSSVTLFELRRGAEKSGRPQRNLERIELLNFLIPAQSFDAREAAFAAQVAAKLESLGTPIGNYDTLIAGHALALDATLVTNNLREFSRIAGLRVENWTL